MSKDKLPEKEVQSLKEELKKNRDNRSLKNEIKDVYNFVVFILGFLFGFAIFVLGLIAIYIGKFATNLPIDVPAIGRLALFVSGVCAVVDAVYIWWKLRKVK